MDIVVVNILVEVILFFFEDVYKVFKLGGIFIVFGIIEDKVKVVEEVFKKVGFVIEKME